MDRLTLTKIPFLITATWALNSATTPPNTPSAVEQVKPDKAEVWIRFLTRNFRHLFQATFWGFTLLEIAALLANTDLLPPPPQNGHALGLGLSLLTNQLHCPDSSRIRISRPYLAAWLLAISGLAIRRSSYRALGRFFTFELSVRKDHKLVTSGPYAVVRHPGYTGLTMCVVGVAVSLFAPGSWIVECSGAGYAVVYPAAVVGGYLLSLVCRRIAEEDEVLRREFGGEWEAWRAKVPYKLIPAAGGRRAETERPAPPARVLLPTVTAYIHDGSRQRGFGTNHHSRGIPTVPTIFFGNIFPSYSSR